MAAITGLLALIFSCGLDVFIYLHPVTYRDFVPSPDPLFNYFSFLTSDSRNHNDAADYFKGFEFITVFTIIRVLRQQTVPR